MDGCGHRRRSLNMPLELQIIRANEFIRMGATGHFDLPASKAALTDLARACRKRGLSRALMDLRALRPGPKPVFSTADLVELVETFRKAGFSPEQRLAILYHSDPHHRARLFAFLSTLRGWSVQAFADYEEAINWLSRENESPVVDLRSSPGKTIPVRDLKRQPAAASMSRHAKSLRPRAVSAARAR